MLHQHAQPTYTIEIAGNRTMTASALAPVVMGVLNVTPDSFSDGGRFTAVDQAVQRALQMVADGARIIDIGGESTRPNADPVPEDEELRRVIPVIERLVDETDIPISIDTMKASVAEKALAAGVAIINDVAANRADDTMWRVAADHGAGYVLMHMRGEPQTMQDAPVYDDVIQDVSDFFEGRVDRFVTAGGRESQLILDVGIGFGKTIDHNLQLLANLERFLEFNRPLLIGTSRKSFIGKLLDLPVDQRTLPSVTSALFAADHGAAILRVHDVQETVTAVKMRQALLRVSNR